MHSISTGAPGAPSFTPTDLRVARVASRLAVSPALAALVAGLAFPAEPRDHVALLVSTTAHRIGSAVHG